MTTTLQYSVGDAPALQFQILEPSDVSDPNAPAYFVPDVTGWTAVLLLVPRQGGVPTIRVSLAIVDAGDAIFEWDVPGGLLPGETPPLVLPTGSFSKAATYDGTLVVRTTNPDGTSGEVLTTEPFVLVVSARI